MHCPEVAVIRPFSVTHRGLGPLQDIKRDPVKVLLQNAPVPIVSAYVGCQAQGWLEGHEDGQLDGHRCALAEGFRIVLRFLVQITDINAVIRPPPCEIFGSIPLKLAAFPAFQLALPPQF